MLAHPVPGARPDPRSDREVVEAHAAEHLPDGVREQWLALLRPAVRLVPSAAPGDRVARLGGLPVLPDDVPWPVWEGQGPLAYVGEVDCAALAGFDLDLALPTQGRLLFFYFDGRQGDDGTTVGYFEPGSRGGYCALHLPDGGRRGSRRPRICCSRRRRSPGGPSSPPPPGSTPTSGRRSCGPVAAAAPGRPRRRPGHDVG